MAPHVRLCRRCNYTGVYNTPGRSREVIIDDCPGCGNQTQHRPICDDWDGEWLPTEKDDPTEVSQ